MYNVRYDYRGYNAIECDGQGDEERMWEAGRILFDYDWLQLYGKYSQEQLSWAFAMSSLCDEVASIIECIHDDWMSTKFK